MYAESQCNANVIESFGHDVRYQVDATKLLDYFESNTFDRMHFNFPHWRGKANIRYNRLLLRDFFSSASAVLAPQGQIQLALMDPQGGMGSITMQAWKQSWMPAVHAANAGLLLVNVEPFLVRDSDTLLPSHARLLIRSSAIEILPFTLLPPSHTSSLHTNSAAIDFEMIIFI